MDQMLEVTDPTDWQSTSLPAFERIDSFLRCQICKEFFDTALITSCNHSFCSLCIRRCITSNGKCPTCQTNEQESRLRKNVTLQEVTDAYVATRTQALQLALENATIRQSEEDEESLSKPRQLKRKRHGSEREKVAEEQGQRRSQRRKVESSSQSEVMVIDDDEKDDDYKPEDGRVACPICGKRMKEQFINSHLDHDQCAEPPPPSTSSDTKTPPKIQKSTKQLGQTSADNLSLERLPQLNYSLLNERALSKKLSELGLPSSGPKPLLIKRHLEWINIWNANCDSSRPRKRKDLMDALSRWERTQGGLAPTASQNTIMRKDFDGNSWATKHKDDFKELIANARKKKSSHSVAVAQGSDDGPTNTENTESNKTGNSEAGNSSIHTTPSKLPPLSTQGDFTESRNQDRKTSEPPLPLTIQPPSSESGVISKPMFEVPKEPVTDVEIGGI